MPSSISLKRKNGMIVVVPDIGSAVVPQVGETIKVSIGGEVVTVRVTGVKRHYIGADIDNPLHAIEGEEV